MYQDFCRYSDRKGDWYTSEIALMKNTKLIKALWHLLKSVYKRCLKALGLFENTGDMDFVLLVHIYF